MRNSEVALAFLQHSPATGSNYMSTGEKLFSYRTCIAQWTKSGLIINRTKYSVTTSKHQSYLNCKPLPTDCRFVYDIPIGTLGLK